MPATDGMWVPRSELKIQCCHMARGWRLQIPLCQTHRLGWAAILQGCGAPQQMPTYQAPSARPCLPLLAEVGTVPRAEGASLSEAGRATPVHSCAEPMWQAGAAEDRPLDPSTSQAQQGRGDRREQGPGSSTGPQVSGASHQLDLGSHGCSSGCLTGPPGRWQEGE